PPGTWSAPGLSPGWSRSRSIPPGSGPDWAGGCLRRSRDGPPVWSATTSRLRARATATMRTRFTGRSGSSTSVTAQPGSNGRCRPSRVLIDQSGENPGQRGQLVRLVPRAHLDDVPPRVDDVDGRRGRGSEVRLLGRLVRDRSEVLELP